MSKRAVRRFLVAFAATIAIAVLATTIRDGARNTASTPVVTTVFVSTTLPSSTSSEPLVTSSTTLEFADLPKPDFERYCRDVFGPESSVVQTGGALGARCSSADTRLLEIDVSANCRSLYGEGSRAILREVRDAVGWSCSPIQRIDIGAPEWNLACRSRVSESAVATRVAADSGGWRCAVISAGLFTVSEIPIDAACQATYGLEVFGEATSPAVDDVSCFAVPANS